MVCHPEPALLENATSVTVSIAGQGQINVWIDGQSIMGVTHGPGDTISTVTAAVVPSADFKGYIGITVLPTAAAKNCFVEGKFVFTYADNSTRTLLTNVTDWFAVEYNNVPVLAMHNPWNLTQRNWEYAIQMVAKEKE